MLRFEEGKARFGADLSFHIRLRGIFRVRGEKPAVEEVVRPDFDPSLTPKPRI